jgi:hypothetical protein
MWLPNWLYRILPFIYSVTGLVCFYFSENWIACLSGVLLITAGIIVWKLRKEFKDVQMVTLK